MTAFFIPTDPGRDGESAYQRLRIQTELCMGRAPRRRRISELSSRRGGSDCITTVGQPDPICGDLVIAIFDMGPGAPFIIYRQDSGDPEATTCELLATTAYAVSDFAT